MRVEVNFPGGVRADATINGRTVFTDQPEAAGGGGSAPSPYEVFLSSLAACAGYFAIAFCKERGINTEGMKLVADFEKNPETKVLAGGKLTLILPKDFPEKYRKPIIRTMDQCSVKKAIAANPQFEVEVG